MYTETCRRCLFNDICPDTNVCDGFYPADEDFDLEQIIETNRTEFYNEWYQYVSKNNNELFF